jgi:hypothetical protein
MSEQNALVSAGGAQATSSEHFVNTGMDFVQRGDALLFGAPPSSFNFQGSQIHIKSEQQPIMMPDLATQRRRKDAGVTPIVVVWMRKDNLPDEVRLDVDDLIQSLDRVTLNSVSHPSSFMESYAKQFILRNLLRRVDCPLIPLTSSRILNALAGSESLVEALTRLPIDITQCQNLCLSSQLQEYHQVTLRLGRTEI